MTKQLCDSSVIANNAQKIQKLFVQGYSQLSFWPALQVIRIRSTCIISPLPSGSLKKLISGRSSVQLTKTIPII